jgi:hypothetical protein
MIVKKHLSSILNLSLFLIGMGVGILPLGAMAIDIRVGGSLGFGGAGLTKSVLVSSRSTLVSRSEGPGVFSLFAETLLTDKSTFGVEHSRGFGLGPFSSGVSFTGIMWRRYFLGPVPSVIPSKDGRSTLFIKRYIPFVGLASGVAMADISREQDQVGNVKGTGVYFGTKFGLEYPLSRGMGIRPEIIYNMTMMNSSPIPSSLSEFALQCGFYYAL